MHVLKTRLLFVFPLAIVLGLGLTLHAGVAWGHHASPDAAVSGSSPITPRLIVRPHSVRLDITLPRGIRLTGTLTPAIPGPNSVHLIARPGTIAGGRLRLEAVMPGMAMAPATATLTERNHEYRGVLPLPMFGRYRLRITLAGGITRFAGTIELPLLPSWSGLSPSSASR